MPTRQLVRYAMLVLCRAYSPNRRSVAPVSTSVAFASKRIRSGRVALMWRWQSDVTSKSSLGTRALACAHGV